MHPQFCESASRSAVSDSLLPHGLWSPWNSAGQNTGVGSLSLLQGMLPTQGSNLGLPHCRQIFYQLSLKGSPHSSSSVIMSKNHVWGFGWEEKTSMVYVTVRCEHQNFIDILFCMNKSVSLNKHLTMSCCMQRMDYSEEYTCGLCKLDLNFNRKVEMKWIWNLKVAPQLGHVREGKAQNSICPHNKETWAVWVRKCCFEEVVLTEIWKMLRTLSGKTEYSREKAFIKSFSPV